MGDYSTAVFNDNDLNSQTWLYAFQQQETFGRDTNKPQSTNYKYFSRGKWIKTQPTQSNCLQICVAIVRCTNTPHVFVFLLNLRYLVCTKIYVYAFCATKKSMHLYFAHIIYHTISVFTLLLAALADVGGGIYYSGVCLLPAFDMLWIAFIDHCLCLSPLHCCKCYKRLCTLWHYD